jgi:hypothetical protein
MKNTLAYFGQFIKNQEEKLNKTDDRQEADTAGPLEPFLMRLSVVQVPML